MSPTVETPDEPFDRLRAADPSASATPDLARMRASIAGPSDAQTTGAVDELAAARARRRPARWLQVAAAVAGIAVIGSGGFALGRQDGSSPAAAPISLSDAAAGMDAAAESSGAAGTAQAPGAADSARSLTTDKMASSVWWGGRTVFTGAGLSTEGGSATAWTFDPSAVFSQETAARVAAALGVAGSPTEQWGAWSVGPQDGTGPNVQLQPDGLASVSYYDPQRDPWACVQSAPDSPDSSGTTTDGTTTDGAEPAEIDPTYGCTFAEGPAPAADVALAAARDTMTALDVDPAGYELEVVADSGMQAATMVSAYQVLDEQRSGVTWSFTVVADGVQSLYGSLAPAVELGTYALVSPAEAVERLGDPRFGSSYGGVMPLAEDSMRTMEGEATDMPAPTATVPPTLAAGSAIPWPVSSVTLTTSRLGLGMTTLADGATVLVPSYELGSDDGSTWSVNAVAEDRLDFAASS